MKPPSKLTAILLELIPAFLFQTFGLGHIYAGNYILGILIMLGYWIIAAVNVVLCFVFLGYITLPIFWFITLIISTILLSRHLEEEK